MSIEMERTAHATLRLRAFARRLMDADGRLPQDYIDYLGTPSSENLERLKDSHPEEWAAAEAEAIQGTLKEGDDEFVERARRANTLGMADHRSAREDRHTLANVSLPSRRTHHHPL